MKDIARLHSFKKLFVAVFPVNRGVGEIRGKGLEQPVALTVVDGRPEAYVNRVSDGTITVDSVAFNRSK